MTKNDYIMRECTTLSDAVVEYTKYYGKMLKKSQRKIAKIVR